MIKIVDDFLDPELATELHFQASIREDINSTTFSGYSSIDFLDFQLPQKVLLSKFPELQSYQIVRSWGFIYDSNCVGVPPHADPADLNLNFWLTPDACIDDKSKNGLNIWLLTPPNNWSFISYNANTKRIVDFIGDARPCHIPYRFNRAVLFDSNYFHSTDHVSTHPGKLNRRVSYTFLFQKNDHIQSG